MRIWYIFNNNLSGFGRRLNINIAYIQKRCDEPENFGFDVFNILHPHLHYISGKKPQLFYINHSLIGNNQYIQIVIGPDNKNYHPNKKPPGKKPEDSQLRVIRKSQTNLRYGRYSGY